MDKQEKYNSPFAANLRELIAQKSTTITALAKTLGISRQAVSQYADGTGQPNVDKLYMIAEYFGVSADYLLGLSEVPTRNETIQGVHDFTGLSQEAIANLHTEKYCSNSNILDFVSFLLENEKFGLLCKEIEKSVQFRHTTVDGLLDIAGETYKVEISGAFKLIVTDMFWEIMKDYKNSLPLAEISHPTITNWEG